MPNSDPANPATTMAAKDRPSGRSGPAKLDRGDSRQQRRRADTDQGSADAERHEQEGTIKAGLPRRAPVLHGIDGLDHVLRREDRADAGDHPREDL